MVRIRRDRAHHKDATGRVGNELLYRDREADTGRVGNELLYRDREADVEIVEEGRPWRGA
jgi:hypothetical protein